MDGESIRHDNNLKGILRYGSAQPRSLRLEDLRRITNNFSSEQLLGNGGFGMVYKGVLPNGEMVAVKKFAPPSPGINNRHFENEVDHLMKLNHPNIVLLLGCCTESDREYVKHNGKFIWVEKPELMLCLEFMPKGSLCGYLSDESSGLAWDIRHKIINGICCGLHYLHEEWNLTSPIIHMDLKPANILLDNNMVPKIADFGLSRLFMEKTRTFTASRNGTLGYMAPEYINKGLISKKADIFSLGVIILEIITGNRNYPDDTQIYPREFIDLVLGNWRERLKKEQEYTSLEIHCQLITRCIQIGLLCVKLDPEKRPTTGQIIEMLDESGSTYYSNIKEVGFDDDVAASFSAALAATVPVQIPRSSTATAGCSSSLPSSYYTETSISSHSLPMHIQLIDHFGGGGNGFFSPSSPSPHQLPLPPLSSSPSSSSGDLFEFTPSCPGPVRRVFSTGDLQRMNSSSPPLLVACSDGSDQEGGGSFSRKVGRYSAEERKERIERYRAKRHQRNFNKKITYVCRKTLADGRPRVKGRFARNGEADEREASEIQYCCDHNEPNNGSNNSSCFYDGHNMPDGSVSGNSVITSAFNCGSDNGEWWWRAPGATATSVADDTQQQQVGFDDEEELWATLGDMMNLDS